MTNTITSVGPVHKVPTDRALRGKLLKNLVEVNALMKHYNSAWSETSCSIVVDGQTNGKLRSLINFLVYYPKGILFFKSLDTSVARKKTDASFGLFEEVVTSVGPKNVVWFIIENNATYKATGKNWQQNMKHFTVQLSCSSLYRLNFRRHGKAQFVSKKCRDS